MPDINALLEKSTKKKFKKSSYRPWNYMDEIQKEEGKKQDEVMMEDKLKNNNIINPIQNDDNNFKKIESNLNNSISDNLEKVIIANNPKLNKTQENNREKKEHQIEKIISPLFSILRLSGYQKIIFNFISDRCLRRESFSSGIVTSEVLISITNTSLNMVNTSIQRLVDKKLIFRENGKRGRGGFYCFGFSLEVKDAIIEYRKLTILDDPELSKLNELQLNGYEVNKNDFKKYSTSFLPKEWEEIDIELLNHIGFSRNHLVQLHKQGDLNIQEIQESIYHFAYDLQYNNKAASITKSSPIGYFMGILKRSIVYAAPDNYESPKDKALRELLERKKYEKEKREAMIKELINIAFEEWAAKLSQEEKDKFIPEEIRKSRLAMAKFSSLKTYFTENIWPKVAQKDIDI